MAILSLFGPPNVEKLQAKRNIAGLTKALNYRKDASVRRAAALALGEIGATSAVEALKERLRESDSAVRFAAVAALGAFSTPEARESLMALLSDSDKTLRRAAADALDPAALADKPALLVRCAVAQEDWTRVVALGPIPVNESK
jgi:HEAT repeat protein